MEVQKPRLLERTQLLPLQFLSALTETPEEIRSNSCARVVVLAAKTTSFLLRQRAGDPSEAPTRPLASVAGAAEIELCGAKTEALGALVLEMRSPRGIVQALRIRSPRESPSLSHFLTHRVQGPAAAPPTSLARPRLPAFQVRESRLRANAHSEPKAEVQPLTIEASHPDGGTVNVLPGCHQITALQLDSEPEAGVVDLDLEIFEQGDTQLITRDFSEDLDATANFCTPEPQRLRLRLQGALPTTKVQWFDIRTPFPSGIPEVFGPMGRGNLATALRSSHASLPEGEPVARVLGVQGRTLLPLLIEPGACYLAIVGAAAGNLRALGLSARTGAIQKDAQGDQDSPTATLAFCNQQSRSVQFEVMARGQNLVWAGAVWLTARLPIGQVAE